MIYKCSVILLLLTSSVCSFAQITQIEKPRESKDLVPESIKQFNQIERLSDESKYKHVDYSQGTCEPKEQVTENGKKVYRDVVGPNKSLRYIDVMYVDRGVSPVEFKINGIHIIIESGSRARFVLTENCTKLLPIGFISGSDQEYLGISLKKRNEFSTFANNMGHLAWGKIGDDGYLKDGEILGLNGDMGAQLNTFLDNYYQRLLQCAKVKVTRNSEEGFYLLEGQKYDANESEPNFWLAHSKYLGHRICSDQPQAKIDCAGSPIISRYADDIIFGITESYPNHATSNEEEERVRQEVAEDIKQAKILGKKCDEAIAKYEKETGKKVKISPFYPKRLLLKDE